MIQWTLTLDGVITSGAIFALLGVLWRLSSRFTKIDDKLDAQDVKLAELAVQTGKIEGVLVTLTDQNRRIEFLEKLVDELRHGEGMVLPLRKSAYEHPRG